MAKNKFLYLFIILFSTTCFGLTIAETKSSKILVKINEIVITKRDLVLYLKIYSKVYNRKSEEDNYIKALENYIDLNKKYIIAKKNGVIVNKKEKTNYWQIISTEIGTKKSFEDFCKEKNIDKIFLSSVMEKYYFWQKYVNEHLKRNININEELVLEYIKYTKIDSLKVRYNISEIVLNYQNIDKKIQVKNILEDLYKKLINNEISFEKATKLIVQSYNTKNNGIIGWIDSSDFSDLFLKNIKNLKKNEFCKPFCIGENIGSCFIILLNDKEKYVNTDDREKIKVAGELYNKILESKINSILDHYNDEIKIIYYNH